MGTSEFLNYATGLLAMLNPLALLPLYQSLVADYPEEFHRRMAVRTTVAATCFMVVIVWLGKIFLDALQVDLGAMQVAGGLIVLKVAFDMMKPQSKEIPHDERAQTQRDPWNIVAVVPLAIPLTTGGGSMAYITAYAVQAQSTLDLVVMSGCSVVVGAACGVMYYFATPIMNTLGPIGTRIIVRLTAVILMAIAVQLTATGLGSLLPGLAG